MAVAESSSLTEPPPDELAKSGQTFELVISPRRVAWTLVGIVVLLVITGSTANYVTFHVAPSPDHKVAKLMNRFDLGFEPSIPNWYSSCTLLAASGLLVLTGLVKRQEKDRYYRYWHFLGFVFLVLSIDEGVRLHEMIHTVMIQWRQWHGVLHFPWVIPAGIFVAVLGACYIPFLWHIERGTAILFMVAGAVYITGVLGMDMAGAVVIEQQGEASVYHTWTQLFEELFEMLGMVLFLYALIDHLGRAAGRLQLRIATS